MRYEDDVYGTIDLTERDTCLLVYRLDTLPAANYIPAVGVSGPFKCLFLRSLRRT
jgi:hypothetical protein